MRSLTLEGGGDGERIQHGDGLCRRLAAGRVEGDVANVLWSHELEGHLDSDELPGLGVCEDKSREARSLKVGVHVELVLLRHARRQVEGLHAMKLHLLAGSRGLRQRQAHIEALGLLQPVGDLNRLHMRCLALHLRTDLLWLARLHCRALKLEHEGIAIWCGYEDPPQVLLRRQISLPASLPARARARLLVRSDRRSVLVAEGHGQRPVDDFHVGRSARRHHDLRRAEPVVHTRRHLCLHNRAEFPRLVGGILQQGLWRQSQLLRGPLPHLRGERDHLHSTVGLLHAAALNNELN
mmetsp:Transcript_58910/g.119989  ORF Transcript_58910/g.119989 Transcript_58910/m.119989 type:complete len:295 (+) Transcript_58910:1106-1990(+)